MWNDESGHWQNLNAPEQAPRYQHLAQLIQQFSPGESLLDIGCGEAVLRSFLPRTTDYFGIEPSATASRGKPNVLCITAEKFSPNGRRWSCVVFNEVLYYVHDPIAVLQKYANFLTPDGIFVVSIYQKTSHLFLRQTPNTRCSRAVAKFFSRHWPVLHAATIHTRWRVWVVAPH